MNNPNATLQPMLDKLAYWWPLDDADREALLSLPHVVTDMDKHRYVVRERDVATHSCVMLSGYSIRHKIVADGRRQIVAIHMRGDMVDLQNSLLGTADHSVQMLTRGKVAMIPRDAVKELALRRPQVAMAMWYDTLVDGSIFREWIANVGRRDSYTRVGHVLCEFALRLEVAGLGSPACYELPMTQEELADVVGLTSVHVNRTLKNLENDGLIGRDRNRAVIIGDWEKLAHAGDFDSNYLHLRENEPALA
jgi:CRP-like cAMP-binding protein